MMKMHMRKKRGGKEERNKRKGRRRGGVPLIGNVLEDELEGASIEHGRHIALRDIPFAIRFKDTNHQKGKDA